MSYSHETDSKIPSYPNIENPKKMIKDQPFYTDMCKTYPEHGCLYDLIGFVVDHIVQDNVIILRHKNNKDKKLCLVTYKTFYTVGISVSGYAAYVGNYTYYPDKNIKMLGSMPRLVEKIMN